MTTYLRVYTVEIGLELCLHWEVVSFQAYVKDHRGNEARLMKGSALTVVFQSFLQHDQDPLGKETLEVVAGLHATGLVVACKIDFRH